MNKEDITEDMNKGEVMNRLFEHHTEMLIGAYKNLSFKCFETAFKGLDITEHLWRQYTTTYNSNLLSFMEYLNKEERTKLLEYIWEQTEVD
jgi:hypothetical protein